MFQKNSHLVRLREKKVVTPHSEYFFLKRFTNHRRSLKFDSERWREYIVQDKIQVMNIQYLMKVSTNINNRMRMEYDIISSFVLITTI
jgi:hypothetical protein